MPSPLTLVLNSAEKRVQLLVLRGRDLLCAQDWLCRTGSMELLAPVMHDAFVRLHLSPLSLDRIACVAGPGSFTGLPCSALMVISVSASSRVTRILPLKVRSLTAVPVKLMMAVSPA